MTTFICSGLLTAAQGPAHAANLSFKPVSDWSVSRMGEGDRAYCALTRSFSGDAVLTFARNGAGKNSLALDLNKKLFKPAATFETKMESGGFNASYQAKAISDQAAMIGMGQKADIFDSMTRSDSLRVTLEGNQYAFDLAGFASGRQSLDSCLENGGSIDITAQTAPAAVQPASVKAASSSAGNTPETGNLSALKDQLAALQRENRLRQERITALEAEMEQARRKSAGVKTDAEAALKKAQDELAIAKAALDEAEKKRASGISSLEKELKDRIAVLTAEKEKASAQAADMKARLDALAQDQQASVKDRDGQAAKLKALESEKAVMAQEVVALKAEVLAQKQAAEQAAKALGNAQSETGAKLSAAQAALAAREKALADKIALLEKDAAEKQKQEAEKRDAEIAALRKNLADRESMIATLKNDSSLKQSEIAAQLASSREALLKREDAAGAASARIAELEKQVASLTAAVKKAEESRVADQNGKDQAESEKIAGLKKDIADAKAARDKAEADMAALAKELGDKLEAGQAELTKVKAELAARDSVAQENAEKNNTLSADATAAQAALQSAKEDLSKAEKSLTEKTALYQDRINALKAELAEARKVKSVSLETVVKQKDDRIAELESRAAELMDDMTAMREEADQYKSQVASLEQTLQVKDRQIMTIQAAKAGDATAAASLVKADAKETNALKEQVAALQSENRQLKEALENTVNRKELSEAFDTLTRLKAAEVELDAVKAERAKLASRLDEMRESEAARREELAKGNWDLEKATRRFNEAERQISRLSQQMDEIRLQASLEKKELEYKLFDPKIAAQEQITRLLDLEKRAAGNGGAFESEKRAYEEKIAALESRAAGVPDAEVARRISEAVAGVRAESETEQSRRFAEERKALEQKWAAERMAYEEKIAGLTEQTAARQKAEYDRRLAQAVAEIEDKKEAEYQQKVASLSQQIETRQAKILGDKASVASRLQAQQSQLYQQNLASLQKQIETQKAEIARLNQEKAAQAEDAAQARAAARVAAAQAAQNRLPAEPIKTAITSATPPSRAVQANVTAGTPGRAVAGAAVPRGATTGTPSMAPMASARPPLQGAADDRAAREVADIQPAASRFSAAQPANGGRSPSTSQPQVRFSLTQEKIGNLIARSGAGAGNGVQQIGGQGDSVAFKWDTGQLFGSAEQRVSKGGSETFTSNVNNYLVKLKSRCQGDFAAVPVTSRSGPESSISSYDIACVSREGANASASVVFYGDNAFFTAIAQEGAVENMDIAMDSRDRLVSYLSQGGL